MRPWPGGTLRIGHPCLERIGGVWIIQLSSAERIEKFGAHFESLLIVDPEAPADAELLVGTTLVAEIIIVSWRSSILSGRIGPCGRIQHEIGVRIVVAAVQVLQ
jgi:hypothetical protein